MQDFHEYWTFSAIRGALTILASVAVFATPQAAAAMLSIPVLLALSAVMFATYSVFDAVVTGFLARLLPERARHRKVLYMQAAASIASSASLFLLVYGILPIAWALSICIAQAAIATVAEFEVARDAYREYKMIRCFARAAVLTLAVLALPFAYGMDATAISLALASYIGLYGLSATFLGADMLFVEYRASHPVSKPSTEWMELMEKPAAPFVVLQTAKEKSCAGNCDTCRGRLVCKKQGTPAQTSFVAA